MAAPERDAAASRIVPGRCGNRMRKPVPANLTAAKTAVAKRSIACCAEGKVRRGNRVRKPAAANPAFRRNHGRRNAKSPASRGLVHSLPEAAKNMERETRLELATPTLARSC
ncbi:hypothetical protein, partial [Lysobacter antibioticus]|uniref:hypothetical protein n=1 Tax=Lysobacter antibioticus TaxID=84531 RepID=UPI001C9881BC